MTRDTDATGKLWGGRFSEPTDRFVERFTASIEFDARLYHHDIQGSIAHARMLAHVGILSDDECGAIVAGLQRIEQEMEAGKMQWSIANEDVHMNVERRLIELVGDVGKRLHTGRSRNDQVATDVRLYLRDEIDAIARRDDALRARWSISPNVTSTRSCPASPTCRSPSR